MNYTTNSTKSVMRFWSSFTTQTLLENFWFGSLVLVDWLRCYGFKFLWNSRNQNRVSLSTAEAEYISLCEAVRALKGIRNFLAKFSLDMNHQTEVLRDIIASNAWTDSAESVKHAKAMDVKNRFIKQIVPARQANVNHVDSEGMSLADLPNCWKSEDWHVSRLPGHTAFTISHSVCRGGVRNVIFRSQFRVLMKLPGWLPEMALLSGSQDQVYLNCLKTSERLYQ